MAANLKLEHVHDKSFWGKYHVLAPQKNTALTSRGFYQHLGPFSLFFTTGYFPLNTGMVELTLNLLN